MNFPLLDSLHVVRLVLNDVHISYDTHMSFIFGLRIMMSSKFACLLDGVKRHFQQ